MLKFLFALTSFYLLTACGTSNSSDDNSAEAVADLVVTSICDNAGTCQTQAEGTLAAGFSPENWSIYVIYNAGATVPDCNDASTGALLESGKVYTLRGTFTAGVLYTFHACSWQKNSPQSSGSPGIYRTLTPQAL